MTFEEEVLQWVQDEHEHAWLVIHDEDTGPKLRKRMEGKVERWAYIEQILLDYPRTARELAELLRFPVGRANPRKWRAR